MEPLLDKLNRPLETLRISIADRCNFRCVYCMPKEVYGRDHVFLERKELLSFEEIARVTAVFAQLGVRVVRITGGEPLVRRNVEDLVELLHAIPGLELALTTNGALLPQKAEALARAGLDRVTVSLAVAQRIDTRTLSRIAAGVKRRFRLSPQFVLPVTVAGREVKCDKAGDTRSSCHLAGLARGQMPCLRGNVGVNFEERRFNEQVVCVMGEGDDLFDVLVMIGDVDHISDFLPTRYAQGVLSENAQRH